MIRTNITRWNLVVKLSRYIKTRSGEKTEIYISNRFIIKGVGAVVSYCNVFCTSQSVGMILI